MENETHKKILFKYYSDYLDEVVSETMWAEIIDLEKGLFKLDNIPFFGPLIATDDIFYAEAMGDYVKFYTKEKMFAIHGTMKAAEERLLRDNFIRVHRSYIVAVGKIDTLQDGGIIINGKFIPVADAYRKALNTRMNVF